MQIEIKTLQRHETRSSLNYNNNKKETRATFVVIEMKRVHDDIDALVIYKKKFLIKLKKYYNRIIREHRE